LSPEIQRTLALINVTVFVASLGLGSFTYFVPVFAKSLGAGYLDLGIIGTANAIPYVIFPLATGYMVDRQNKAKVYFIGTIFNILATFLLVFASSVRDLIVLRAIGGIGLALFWPTVEALISDIADPNVRLKAMSRYSVAYSSAFLIGPLAGGYITQTLGFSPLFLISSAEIAVAGVLVALTVIPRYSGPLPPASQLDLDSNQGSNSFGKVLPMMLIALPYSIVLGVVASILPGYLTVIGIAKPDIGLLFAIFGISRVVGYNYSWKFSGTRERIWLLLLAFILSLSFYFIGISTTYVAFALALIFMGISFGVLLPISLGNVARHVPRERLGWSIGIYESLVGVGFSTGPFIGGWAAESLGPSSSYYIMSLVSLSLIPPILKWSDKNPTRLAKTN